MSKLSNLEPKNVMKFFEEISAIPRGSGNEKQVSDYCVSFAKERNLEVRQDEANNVVIKKAGTLGLENKPVVALQGHLDMVCEKNKGTEHDFLTQGIDLVVDGDFIRANGTTLGADNGIAVAMSLALLDSDDLAHPPLEVIFTTDEEVGLLGAAALNCDDLKATYMINIDSEAEGVLTTSCAGGAKSFGRIEFTTESVDESNYTSYVLKVNGLKGGHSGVDIREERGNANKLLSRVLNRIRNTDIRFVSFDGGAKDNAIPREAETIIYINNNEIAKVEDVVKTLDEIYRKEYASTDAGVKVSLEKVNATPVVMKKADSDKILNVLSLLPNGISHMNLNIEGLVETSNNVGAVKTYDNYVEIACALRSSSLTRRTALEEQVQSVYDVCGAVNTFRGKYPGWEFKVDSKLREVCCDVYKEITGTDAVVEAIHAGLECGLLLEKMGDVDVISIGPNMSDIHTPDEKISISSIERTYKFLIKVLQNL